MGYLLGGCHVFLDLQSRMRMSADPGRFPFRKCNASGHGCAAVLHCKTVRTQGMAGYSTGLGGSNLCAAKTDGHSWISVFDEMRAIFARRRVSSIDKNLENRASRRFRTITKGIDHLMKAPQIDSTKSSNSHH